MFKRTGQIIFRTIKASVRERQKDQGNFKEAVPATQQHWRADWRKWVPQVEYPLIGVRNRFTLKITLTIEDKAEGRREKIQFVPGAFKQQEAACHLKQLYEWKCWF